MSRGTVTRRLADQPLRNLGVLGAGLLLASTAAFGGLEPVEAAGPAPFELGAQVTAAPFEITVDRAVWVDELPGVYLLDDSNRWLALVATVVNTHTESLGHELAEAVRLVGVEGLLREPLEGTAAVVSSEQSVLADGSGLSPVQPGLPYEMVFLFEQDGSVPPPTEVTVQIAAHTWRADSFDGFFSWLDPTVVAEGTVPIRLAVDSTDGEAAS